MRTLAWVIGGLVLLVGVAFGIQLIASETGEVAVLHVDADGAEHTTRIWVIEDLGHVWVRGGDYEGSWGRRAATHPAVRLERDGEATPYTAEVQTEPAVVQRINAGFRQKYGWRDVYVSYLIGDPQRDAALVLKLNPRRE